MAYSQAILKTQIENIIGSSFSSSLYDDWLIAGARTIVDILKPEDLERHSTTTNVTNSGVTIAPHRIWKVTNDAGYLAIQRETLAEAQLASTSSFYLATSFTPAYIIKGGVLYIYAGGSATSGKLISIQYPSSIDSSNDKEITGIPENMHYATVLYAAIQGRLKQMSDLNATLHSAAEVAITTLSALSIDAINLTTQYANLEQYLITDEDLEMAKGVMEDIQTRLADWQANASVNLKAVNEAQMNKIQAELGALKAHVEGYSAEVQALNASMQQLQSEYHSLIDVYLGRTQKQSQNN